MPSCLICKEKVTAGFVVCGGCARKLEPFTLPADLAYFIDQLAEDIVLDENICSCSMCSFGNCSSQVSGLTCRNGVKAWLLSKAGEYLSPTAPLVSKANTYADALEAREARKNGTVGHDADKVIDILSQI